MAFNVNDFKARLPGGGARSTLFEVDLTGPPGLQMPDKTKFLVRAATIPSADIQVISIPYFGRNIKTPGDRQFAPWTVTIINDEDFAVRNVLEKWSNSINEFVGNKRKKPTTGLGAGNVENYKASQSKVTQYAKDGAVLRRYIFNGLFPSVIQPIDLSWDSTNTIEDFQVQFEYDYWTLDDVGTNTNKYTLADQNGTSVGI
jgi:hypothetical protein